MKTRFFTSTLFSLLTLSLLAGDLDGFWRSGDRGKDLEVLYTTRGIKVRSMNGPADVWDHYDRIENNQFRDQRGNCFSLRGNVLEWCTADRRNTIRYSRSDRDERGRDDRDRNFNDRDWNGNTSNRDWSRRDRDSWNDYYRSYEGKWHNHTTGQHIHIDLSRRSLRIKFHGERWFEVIERNRGLFVDKRGNEFLFRNDGIEYRSADGDLSMKFYCDERCAHRDDYRSEYWRN